MIQEFIKASKASRIINDEIILEPINGRVLLEFPFKLSSIYFRKLSGNGLIIIKTDNKQEIKNILSKNKTLFKLDFSVIEIIRNKDSIGEIGVSLEESEILNWKNIIAKCGNYSGIRLDKENLYANAGAWIDSKFIESIETRPPNLIKKEGDKYKFISSGVITNILVNNSETLQKKKDIFPHIEVDKKETQRNEKIKKQDIKNNIVYDSLVSKIFSIYSNNKLAKTVNSNGKDFLILKKFGTFSQSIPNAKNFIDYHLMICAKKLNGNGKLKVSLDGINWSIFSFDSSFVNKFLKLSSNSDNVKIHLSMDEDSSGEILISRICIFEDLIEINPTILNTYSYTSQHENNFPSVMEENIVSQLVSNSVRNSTKESAIVFVNEYSPIINISIQNKIIGVNSYSSRQWAAKIIPSTNGIKFSDNFNLLDHSENFIPDILFTSIENFIPNNKIFLEECRSDKVFTQDEIEKIKKCEIVYSPSIIDQQKLKFLVKNINIKHGIKYWPAANVKPCDNLYFLYLEKDPTLTNLLLMSWKESYPKLLIVGSGVETGLKNIVYISEYESYDKLYSYILGAKSIIDLSINSNYESGFLNLCLALNKNIITNNLFYIFKNAKCIICNYSEEIIFDKIKFQTLIENSINLDNKSNFSYDYCISFSNSIKGFLND